MQLAAAMGRLGTESAFEVLARATRLQQEGRSIINLGIGQPDFPTPPHIVEAAVKALRDGHHGYTPANGILPLREAVAADMALRRGVEVQPGPDRDRARRQGHHVHGDRHVRRARGRDHVSGPGLPDLPLADRVDRRGGRADRPAREPRLRLLGRGGARRRSRRARG